MAAIASFVPIAEAGFIGGLSTPQMHRLVDEGLVPDSLLKQESGTRRFARITAAFARFFFDTESDLLASSRKRIVRLLAERVEKTPKRNEVLALRSMPSDIDWKVSVSPAVTVDVGPYVAAAMARAKEVDDADKLVVEDPDILSALPCFAGTRVPIETVLASLESGVSMERLVRSWPFLTQAHVDAARIYSLVHPRRGRPRRSNITKKESPVLVTRIVRRPKA
ncbi:DUF433 domain-containing protein [Ramlibacter sp.]|uniref:DUF433 domain-containing protein n=1 Tax=Ramlibacter sp. TaxID=1917967 RepID=UPI003D105BDA